MVNLKRPTLRLSPILIQPLEEPLDDLANAESRNNHALEFEFDCDAPKCCVTVQLITPSNEQDSHGSADRTTIYETVFEGGFGRLLKLEDGATIDLGRFEHTAAHGPRVDQSSHKVEKDLTTTEIPVLPEVSSRRLSNPTPTPDHQENARKRRFTAIHFRRRSQNPAVSGPALAVVDNDTTSVNEGGEREKESQNDNGVRVVIQLVALDDFGKELSSVNRQSTYLHVVRLGSSVTGGEDNRSWVVKVVKREATASISHLVDAHVRLTMLAYRLARIRSIYMKFTGFPQPLCNRVHLVPTQLHTRIHLPPRLLSKMNHHPNALYVSARHERSSFCHVATLSRVKNAPLI